MKTGFYPGCSLKGSSREYAESTLALARALEMPLQEIDDWNCCGASSAHAVDKELALALPARVLALAAEQGFDEVVVPCAACYNRLSMTRHELEQHPPLKERVEDVLGKQVGPVKILNVLQWIEKYAPGKVSEKLVRPLGRKVACYYGCLLVRPASVLGFDRTEAPQTMDRMMQEAGATPIDWAFKTECCGGGMTIPDTEAVARLSGDVLSDAAARGAEAVIVACPMCHANLDMRRREINKRLEHPVEIPVLYITQALGLAVGLSPQQLGLSRHFVPVNIF